jgi:hypothetical protein
MNLIYMCVFYQESYIILLKLLIISIYARSNINKETTDILIITSPSFQPYIQKELEPYGLSIKYYLLDLRTLFEAGYARLLIFNYRNINHYKKILYLDTDVLINSDINRLFNLEISPEKLYALKEGHIGHQYWGSQFFDFTKYDEQQSGFTSGVLLFTPSNAIKDLFYAVCQHIIDYIYKNGNMIPICLDQPFIVYNAIMQNKFDIELFETYVENNPTIVNTEKIIYHFSGDPGAYKSKFKKMMWFGGEKMDLFAMTSKNIENKKYSWENQSITFLENGLMDAFEGGTYKQIDSHTFHAFFGGRVHELAFSDDYIEFVSTRLDDNQIVNGSLLI